MTAKWIKRFVPSKDTTKLKNHHGIQMWPIMEILHGLNQQHQENFKKKEDHC